MIDEIEAKGGQAAAALGDLMTADGAQAVIKAAEQAFGIDILPVALTAIMRHPGSKRR